MTKKVIHKKNIAGIQQPGAGLRKKIHKMQDFCLLQCRYLTNSYYCNFFLVKKVSRTCQATVVSQKDFFYFEKCASSANRKVSLKKSRSHILSTVLSDPDHFDRNRIQHLKNGFRIRSKAIKIPLTKKIPVVQKPLPVF
jgi:hypothetical protein